MPDENKRRNIMQVNYHMQLFTESDGLSLLHSTLHFLVWRFNISQCRISNKQIFLICNMFWNIESCWFVDLFSCSFIYFVCVAVLNDVYRSLSPSDCYRCKIMFSDSSGWRARIQRVVSYDCWCGQIPGWLKSCRMT
jgi:hypothetical protein